ncbi:MAG: hypothetical protein HY606_06690 [Planctomycetes bacterium]|nr:hypothetical protein [Planctomycetota bacterium]
MFDALDNNFVIYVISYLAASLVISLIELLLIPDKFKKRWMILFLFILNASLPFAGIIVTFFLTVFILRKQKKVEGLAFNKIHLYESIYEFPEIRRIFGEAFAIEALGNDKLPTDLRLKVLISLSTSKTKQSVRILRNTLSTDEDELRLFSHNVLNKIEKDINSNISQKMKLIEQINSPKDRAPLSADIARLYWELLYLELADDILRDFYVMEIQTHAAKALEFMPDDPSLHLLLGKTCILKNNYKDAYRYLIKAMEYRMPKSKVIPYLCEVLFKQQNYKEAGQLLAGSQELKNDPALQPVVALWES